MGWLTRGLIHPRADSPEGLFNSDWFIRGLIHRGLIHPRANSPEGVVQEVYRVLNLSANVDCLYTTKHSTGGLLAMKECIFIYLRQYEWFIDLKMVSFEF